jgi:competence protein ComEC
MSYAIGGYVAAMIATHALPTLPDDRALLAACAIGGLAAFGRTLRLVTGVAVGIVVATLAARDALERRVAPCVDGRAVELVGIIDGLPKARVGQVQFDVAVDGVAEWPACAGVVPRRLRLTWFDGPPLEPGERWQLRASLRGIRGYQNPGGFDYEAWTLANGIDGGGNVAFGRKLDDAAPWSWDRLRLDLRKRFASVRLRQAGILLALLTGDAGLMDERDWVLFRATGTVHLMVISGLHLTIVGVVGIALGRGFARLSPRLLARDGSTRLGVAVGVACVTLYACLAGWGVAVLRAWVAASVAAFLVGTSRRAALPTTFLWVAAIVLTVDPLAPLQAGFWLSVVAVAILLGFFAPRVARMSMLRALVVAQLVMAVVMAPALVSTVGSVALIGPLANVVAVPVLSAVVVPIDLVAALLMVGVGIGEPLLRCADVLTDWTIDYLETLAAFGWIGWRTDPSPFVELVSIVACATILLPLGWRHRALLVPCAFLSLLPNATAPRYGDFRLTVFDVGQGLAALVETSAHRLLYDAGPRYRSGFDLGRVVVVPALSSASIDRLDAVVLSHADVDHVGGFGAVAEAIDLSVLLGGEPVPGAPALRLCPYDSGWQWDGVRFRTFRWPHAQRDNDHSCVLSIENVAHRALLPGDVTRAAEPALLDWLGAAGIDVLVAAHHGSRSSSSEAFVRRTAPRVVVFSAGHLNRFGHPHETVVCRFRAVGARSFHTAYSGALTWTSERPGEVDEMRRRTPPYWRVRAKSEDEWQTCVSR